MHTYIRAATVLDDLLTQRPCRHELEQAIVVHGKLKIAVLLLLAQYVNLGDWEVEVLLRMKKKYT